MTASAPRLVSCPNCGAPVPWAPESRYRPFCSARCKLIDLGQWATERYRVPDESVRDAGEAEDSPEHR